MISIITSVRNQLAMNQLYWEHLRRYTAQPFELIVIDNGSTDGSRQFFERQGVRVIANEANYSYPRCQNQGIRAAQYDTMAFLNNDLWLSPRWDERLMHLMQTRGFDFLSPASNERVESVAATKQLERRWKYIKYPVRALFGDGRRSLTLMHRLMYGQDWEGWTEARYRRFGSDLLENFSGSSILATRRGLEKIGGYWDEQQQGADFDLYLRTKKRSLNHGDVRPIHVALGVYVHHYSRLTVRSRHRVSFADAANLSTLEAKWGTELPQLLSALDH
jgi:GT2 family glycosyltransferase